MQIVTISIGLFLGSLNHYKSSVNLRVPKYCFPIIYMMVSRISCLVLLLSLLTISSSQSQSVVYKENSLSRGLSQVVVANDLMGGGVAVFDYNNDGWQDIFLVSGIAKSKLFKNLGNGIFTDATQEAGGFARTGAIRTMGVVTGDLDNDGHPEIIISTGRDLPNIVYKNNGNGTFTEITNESGLRTTSYTIPILVGDYNLDGLLDVYMINYIKTPRSVFDSQGGVIGFAHICYPNELFVNNGNLQFTEMAEALGVADAGCGLGGIFTDVDGDYLPDLYIANDFGEWTGWPNALYKNTYPDLGFDNISEASNSNAAIYGMGVAQGDINNDGLLDLHATNMGSNVLYQNNGDGTYTDITDNASISNARTASGLYNVGWGTVFTDPDNDGREDLFISYGYVPGSKIIETSWTSEDKFYYNAGSLPFLDIGRTIGLGDRDLSRGSAIADFDNDGDEDIIATKLIVTSAGVKPNVLFYENKTINTNKWVQISLQGSGVTVNRDAFGSTVKVYAGDLLKVETLSGGSSHASQSSKVFHIGLGQKTSIDSVEVFWPGGKRQVIKNLEVNTHYFIEEDIAGFKINGCNDPSAANFNPEATRSYGCFYPKSGCTNPTYANYDPQANVNDGSCQNNTEIITSVFAEKRILAAVYPNPFQERLNIDVARSGNYKIEIFNGQGQLVNSLHFSATENLWYPALGNGLFYYRILLGSNVIQSGKLIKN